MGVLDDLKQAAERRQQELSRAQAGRARQEQTYQTQIRPAMQAIFRYLNEMIGHLNFLKPDAPMLYVIPGYGKVSGLGQEDYRISVDSTDQPKFIKLWFTCKAKDDLTFSVSPRPLAEETREFLSDQRFEFSEWPLRNAFGNLTGLGFEVRLHISVLFIFRADIENGLISMKVVNFEGFETLRDECRPMTVNEDWLEDLGNYLLRRNVSLRALHISDGERQEIRRQLLEVEAERQKELEAAKQRELLAEEEQRNRQLKSRLLKMVQQTKESLSKSLR